VHAYQEAYGLVGRGASGDGALRAAIARVGAVNDCDLTSIRGSAGALRDRTSNGENGKEEGGDFGVHLDSDG
jgi:hypothetical protein